MTCIGISYNPYHPNVYDRWTGGGCDMAEVLVQNDLWEIFSEKIVFDELIDVSTEVGVEMNEKINDMLD
jgi:hypothetical protein